MYHTGIEGLLGPKIPRRLPLMFSYIVPLYKFESILLKTFQLTRHNECKVRGWRFGVTLTFEN